jgi:hypothetical protein
MSAFCLFGRTLPIRFALLGTVTKIDNIKDDSKINREKRTSIAAVRDKLEQIDTFLPPYFLVADYL